MFNFDVLVNGRPVKRYYDENGSIWIEGRKNTAFTLKIKNNEYGRILGIVSVDGLNIVDGNHVPIEDSRGYVINSRSSVNIPGWKINQDEIREFYFTINGDDSYVKKIGADERNIGVIAAAVYKEKVYCTTTWTTYNYPYYVDWNNCSSNININSANLSMTVNSSLNQSNSYISGESENRKINSEGEKMSVGSGEKREFRTNKIDFEKGNFEGEIIIYYDTWEGLKRKGILRNDRNYRDKPQPFPNDRGDYCPDV